MTMATVMSGTYTIVNPKTQGYRTVKIEDPDTTYFTDLTPGTRIAYALTGPDNQTSFTGIGFVTLGGQFLPWKKQAHRTDYIAALNWVLRHGAGQETTLGKAYAVRSGRCFICTRKLTTPASTHYGYGPDCARAHGLPYENAAAPRVTNQLSHVSPEPGSSITRTSPQLSAADTRESPARDPMTKFRVGWQRVSGSPRTYEELFGTD
jgi:hypothetical protein